MASTLYSRSKDSESTALTSLRGPTARIDEKDKEKASLFLYEYLLALPLQLKHLCFVQLVVFLPFYN